MRFSKKQVKRHFFSILLLGFLSFLAVGSFNDEEDKGPSKIGAYLMSQKFVKKTLKSPSSAEFPSYSESFVKKTGEGKYRVTAHFDAENSFGAKLRKKYTCVVSTNDGETWSLESINVE